MRQKLKNWAPRSSAAGSRAEALLLTDTTFRDAHQSLLATRLRTHDMLNIADAYATCCRTVLDRDVGRGHVRHVDAVLKECPWQRLEELRERMPNILFQMLLRASNAVGYTNYPDNVVRRSSRKRPRRDRRVPHLRRAQLDAQHAVAMDAVLEDGAICEAAICYTGDILDPARTEVRPEVLRRPGQATGKDGRPHPGHQGHGRPVQAVRGRAAGQDAQAGDRHPHPLPHARHGRRQAARS
jgi:pyruvate carboxylase